MTHKKDSLEHKHKCALCPYSTNIHKNYNHHLRTHSIQKPFKCAECPFKTKWKDALSAHVTSVHLLGSTTGSSSSRPFPCQHPGCNYRAKIKGSLTKHSKIHSGEKSLSCSHLNCNFSTNNKSSLTVHTRVHSGEKPFVCQFESCSYTAARLADLTRHTSIHTKEKPFKCPEPNCEYSAVGVGNLKKHQLTHPPKEGEERPLFQCPFCEYKGKSKPILFSHMKIHSDEKPFVCSFESCEYRCKFKSSLSLHLKTHSEERRYKCELCPFRGKRRGTVRNHLRNIHSDPNFRPFKCPELQCGFAFKPKGALNEHFLTHNPKKKYVCSFPDCDYRALITSSIKRHEINIHSEEKKEKCPLCSYKCKIKSKLTLHMRTHTKEEPYKCNEPNCEYRTKHFVCILNNY